MSGILFSITEKASVEVKLVIIVIWPLISFILTLKAAIELS